MKTKKFTFDELLPYLISGEENAFVDIARRSKIGGGMLRIILGNAVQDKRLVQRLSAKPGRSNALDRRLVYYIAGTEPVLAERVYPKGTAGPITIYPSMKTGSIEPYAQSLRTHQELAMSIRRA